MKGESSIISEPCLISAVSDRWNGLNKRNIAKLPLLYQRHSDVCYKWQNSNTECASGITLKEWGTERNSLGWWTHQLFLPLTLARAYNLNGSFHCFLWGSSTVSRVQWSDEQAECHESCLLFPVLPSPHELWILGLTDLIPPPQLCLNRMPNIFSSQIFYRLLTSWYPWMGGAVEGQPEWNSFLHWELPVQLRRMHMLAWVLLGSHAGLLTCCKYVTSLCKAVFL